MARLTVLGALLLLCCKDPVSPRAIIDGGPLARPQPKGFRIPTLQCELIVPAGWTASGSPMPDQIAELVATAPNLRGRMVLREAIETSVDEAVEEQKQRTQEAWGGQPGFALLRVEPLGEGRLLAWEWRRQPTAPLERHLIVVLPIASRVVVVSIDDDGETPEAQLRATLTTLECGPRSAGQPD